MKLVDNFFRIEEKKRAGYKSMSFSSCKLEGDNQKEMREPFFSS